MMFLTSTEYALPNNASLSPLSLSPKQTVRAGYTAKIISAFILTKKKRKKKKAKHVRSRGNPCCNVGLGHAKQFVGVAVCFVVLLLVLSSPLICPALAHRLSRLPALITEPLISAILYLQALLLLLTPGFFLFSSSATAKLLNRRGTCLESSLLTVPCLLPFFFFVFFSYSSRTCYSVSLKLPLRVGL